MPDLSTIPDQTLAELVISGIHGDEDIAVDNLQVGTPPGGWTATVTRADGAFVATYNGGRYREEPQKHSLPKAQPL